jgi:hypothetical protein
MKLATGKDLDKAKAEIIQRISGPILAQTEAFIAAQNTNYILWQLIFDAEKLLKKEDPGAQAWLERVEDLK